MKKPQWLLLPSGILLVLLSSLLVFGRFGSKEKIMLICIMGGICLLLMLLTAFFFSLNQKSSNLKLKNVFQDNRSDLVKLANVLSFPCLLMDQKGTVLWRNDAMDKIFPENSIKSALPKFNLDYPPHAVNLEYSNTSYQVFSRKFL